MNSVQMHLALTHVPVILTLVGLVMLIAALLMKNTVLTKTSYFIIIIAGITALPVYFSGEEAEEAVEHIVTVSESLVEEHEEVAKLAMISIVVAGIFALISLFSFNWFRVARFMKTGVMLSLILSTALMIQTAHLGGQIRHTEINNSAAAQNETGSSNENNFNANNNADDDD